MPLRKGGRFMTEEEYLRFEEKSQFRHEFVDGYVYAMTGASWQHNRINTNLIMLIGNALKGSDCWVHGIDLKVRLEAGSRYYYPDLVVVCESEGVEEMYLDMPVVIVEILSPSTSSIDRREKLEAYQKIPSMKAYIVVWQDIQHVELHLRGQDDEWTRTCFKIGEVLELDVLCGPKLRLPVSELYAGYNPPGRVKEEGPGYSVEADCPLQ